MPDRLGHLKEHALPSTSSITLIACLSNQHCSYPCTVGQEPEVTLRTVLKTTLSRTESTYKMHSRIMKRVVYGKEPDVCPTEESERKEWTRDAVGEGTAHKQESSAPLHTALSSTTT